MVQRLLRRTQGKSAKRPDAETDSDRRLRVDSGSRLRDIAQLGRVCKLRRAKAGGFLNRLSCSPEWCNAKDGIIASRTSNGTGEHNRLQGHHAQGNGTLRAGRCRLQPSLHRPPFRPDVLRRRRRLRRPRTVRAAAVTGTPFAPVPVQPSGRPLRPGIGHRPGVEPLLLSQRRRRDRPRRGPRLAGRRPRAPRPQPRHAGQTVRTWVWAIRWPSPRPTSRPSSPATTGRSSAA